MIRTFDAAFINRIVNDPSVFEHVSLGLDYPLDLTPAVLDPRNYCYANEHGAFILVSLGDGVYDVHTQFLPSGRGAVAIEAARETMFRMFTETDCVRIRTDCPMTNRRSAVLARAVGMKRCGAEEVLGVPCVVYSITKDEWLCQQQRL